MELADVVDSKSTASDGVPVRVRPPAPRKNNTNSDEKSEFVLFFTRDYFGVIIKISQQRLLIKNFFVFYYLKN